MITLAELKERLSSLPDKRKRAELGATFAAHLGKVQLSRQKAERALAVCSLAQELLPSTGYSEANARARKAGQQASRLQKKLEGTPEGIREASVDHSFTILNDHAEAAWKECSAAWEKEVDAKVKDWATLVDVMSRLVPQQGGRLRTAVSALQSAKNRPPGSKTEARQIEDHLKDLNDVVGKLGLKGAFGKFLRATASQQGADSKDLLDPEVQEKINQHKLWNVFRVKLS
jgi:hypothetical protein